MVFLLNDQPFYFPVAIRGVLVIREFVNPVFGSSAKKQQQRRPYRKKTAAAMTGYLVKFFRHRAAKVTR